MKFVFKYNFIWNISFLDVPHCESVLWADTCSNFDRTFRQLWRNLSTLAVLCRRLSEVIWNGKQRSFKWTWLSQLPTTRQVNHTVNDFHSDDCYTNVFLIFFISTKYNEGSISFNVDKDKPLRPYGGSCTSLYCSQKLLDFIRATNVRIHLYNHTLFPSSTTKYFGLSKLVVAGRWVWMNLRWVRHACEAICACL